VNRFLVLIRNTQSRFYFLAEAHIYWSMLLYIRITFKSSSTNWSFFSTFQSNYAHISA